MTWDLIPPHSHAHRYTCKKTPPGDFKNCNNNQGTLKNTVQTTVQAGKRDYLIRQRTKGLDTPRKQIPPKIITQQIPQFEIGDYLNIFNDLENDDNEDNELEEIVNKLKTNNKINRSERSDNLSENQLSPQKNKENQKKKKKKTLQ